MMQINLSIIDDMFNEIISEMSLKDKTTLANMEVKDVEVLQSIFNKYIKSKIGIESNDNEEFSVIMKVLWKKLRGNHKLRVVK